MSGRHFSWLAAIAGLGFVAACTAQQSMPTPSVSTPGGATSSSASQSQACADSASVRGIVERFVEAFNAGHAPDLERMWAQPDEAFVWFAANGPHGRVGDDANNRGTLTAYFTERHRHGEQLRLLSFEFHGVGGAYGNFEYRLDRRADDVTPQEYVGKGAVVCTDPPLLGVWAMAPDPAA